MKGHIMLPAFRRISISAVTALAIALPSAPVHAFDAREQGVITGVLGTLLITGIIAENNKHRVQTPVYQTPVYQTPVYQTPVYQQPVYQEPVYQPRVTRTPAAAAFSSYAPSERRLIQRRLARLGYTMARLMDLLGLAPITPFWPMPAIKVAR
jgi:hypothetical protein